MKQHNEHTIHFLLRNSRRRMLTERELNNAGKRVWNSLASELNLDSTQVEQHTTQSFKINWRGLKLRWLGISFICGVLALTLLAGIIWKFQPVTTDFATTAEARFDELSPSFKYTDLKKLSEANPELLTNSISKEAKAAPIELDESEIYNVLGQTPEKSDKALVTVEKVEAYEPELAKENFGYETGIEMLTSVATSNSFSFKSTRDDKLTRISFSKGNSSFDYAGGKYAVRIVTDAIQVSNTFLVGVSGIGYSAETSVLGKILSSDPTITQLPNEVISGQEYTVFRETGGFQADTSLKYYFGMSDSKLKFTDALVGDKVVGRVTQIRSELVPVVEAATIISDSDLAGIEIKTVNMDPADTTISLLSEFTRLAEKTELVYAGEKWQELSSPFDQSHIQQTDPISKLMLNTEFDPDYTADTFTLNQVGAYMQNTLEVTMFKTDMESELTKYQTVISKSDAVVTVDGKEIPAVLYVTDAEDIEFNAENQQMHMIKTTAQNLFFTYKGIWYVLVQRDSHRNDDMHNIKYDLANLTLHSVTKQQAVELDKLEKERMQEFDTH